MKNEKRRMELSQWLLTINKHRIALFFLYLPLKKSAFGMLILNSQPATCVMQQFFFYWVCNSSQYSTALRVWGITMVPPTRFATEKISKISSVVTPNSWHLPRWYFTQSSHRNTIDETSPSISLVLVLSAPSWYVSVSTL